MKKNYDIKNGHEAHAPTKTSVSMCFLLFGHEQRGRTDAGWGLRVPCGGRVGDGNVSRYSGGCHVVAGGDEWTACTTMAGIKHAASVKSGFVARGSIRIRAQHGYVAYGGVAKLLEYEAGLV
ncbi:hypothetical protein M3629_19325 [Paenibacillus polysaccharolyticus]|uniref:hypothetical protein n=1 Tax=Paenibacillus polysaccharolyticus TaxID=582692 RepID=UPI00203D4C7F|nr:hypothetical protein [Paenibacillus polysaccharolyticus]MCM3134935.1 hypothetical protein [Paenibacillus polysaccharolyticus]